MVSSITPFGLIVLFSVGILILTLKREQAFIPLILFACYYPVSGAVVIAGLNFFAPRLLLLFAWARVLLRREISTVNFNNIDKSLVWYVALSVVMNFLLERSGSALANRLGQAYDLIGFYFFFRAIILNFEDIERIFRFLGLIILPLTCLMLYEEFTGRNLFSLLGGVPEFSAVRGDQLRAQGPFRHPVLAGTFGATVMPFFVGVWLSNTSARIFAISGFVCATAIMILTSSSGPALAYCFGIIALFFWRFRERMRAVRWALFFSLIGLHLIMKAPIWFLIGRISNLIGGTGWHRSELIDQAIKHFDEWCFVGTTYTAHWARDTGLITLPDFPNMVDITNQYIVIAVNGGILPLAAFIAAIAFAFREVGKAWRSLPDELNPSRLVVWSLGASLFSHVVSFTSISYFDQLNVFWFLLLAMISSLSYLTNPQYCSISPNK